MNLKQRKLFIRVMAALLVIMMILPLIFTGIRARAEEAVPELHTIPYPENYPTTQDEDGADACANALDHPETRYYAVNDYYSMESGGTLHILSGFETYQQTTEYTCGAASALMVLHRFGEDAYDEMTIAELAKANTTMGTSVEGLADFFAGLGWNVDAHGDVEPRFADPTEAEAYLIEKLDAGIPVMVDWVDWAGHWQIAIGLDTCGTDDPYDDVLILADPYDITDHFQDGYYIFPFGRFFDMWYEGACVQKEVPYEQPFVAAWPQD